MNTWHERLKLARKDAGLKASRLAASIGVSSATISDWESGETKRIEGENLLKVCDALNINPHWLIFGKGEMHPPETSYSADPRVRVVVAAMERMADYKKDMLVAASNTLSKE